MVNEDNSKAYCVPVNDLRWKKLKALNKQLIKKSTSGG